MSLGKLCYLICFLDPISFQFVVSDSGDYTIHAMDPDVLVEWDFIEQVVSFFLRYSAFAMFGGGGGEDIQQ